MEPDSFEHYKNYLLSLKEEYKRIENSIVKNNDHDVSEREEYDELSFYDNHPADLGSEAFLREMSYARLDNVKNRLMMIEDALKRIKEKTYGVCIGCGKKIESGRLEAVPYTPYCLECEKKHEYLEGENTNFRPPEEAIIPHNFGDLNFDDKEENVEFDGEDTYQALETFNKTNDPSLQTGDQTGIFDETTDGTVETTDNISDIYYRDLLTDEEDVENEDT